MLPKDLPSNESFLHNDREADELHDQDEDNYTCHDHGTSRRITRYNRPRDLSSWQLWGKRGRVIGRGQKGEYRNGVGSHGNRSRETTSSLIRLLIGPRYS